jgi:cell division septation protein DedD
MGKLLGLFFMLALTCGIFFAVGYSLGKTAEREQALKNQPAQTLPADPDVASSKSSGAGAPGGNASPAEAKQPAPDLTFYKAVKQNPGEETKPEQELKSAETAASSATSNIMTKPHEMAAANPALAKPVSAAKVDAPPSPAASMPQASPSGAYLVQIAAVTHEEDAAALAGALRKKSYAAAVMNSPNGKDKLFHVVLGPYASLQDAEAMKVKLRGEGYSPIVKR